MSESPERFGQILQETLDEFDLALAREAALELDDVEQLRLRAAILATRGETRPWHAGVCRVYQTDEPGPANSPVLDVRFPADSSRTVAKLASPAVPVHVGRSVPRSRMPDSVKLPR